MKILKILYYYYFAFYKKVDNEPHAMTIFALSFSQSLLVNFIIQIISVHYFCYFFSTWQMLGIAIALIFFNYFLFVRTGFAKKLVKSPPPYIINRALTKGFVILFLTGILTKSMLENCR
jgi:hypothetical protein